MSGKHQRRIWSLPIPTGNISRYDRMQIGVGRANSSHILMEHDTLIKTLLTYLFQQDTFIKALTNIKVEIDTLIGVSVSFNYMVDQDTLIKILTSISIAQDTLINVSESIPPIPETYSGSGQIVRAPFKEYKKKKKADEIIKLDKIDISNLLPRKVIQIKIDLMFEVKLMVGDVKLLREENVRNLTILNVDLINISNNNVGVEIFDIKEDLNDNN